MESVLDTLFESGAKVKIMRLFLQNSEQKFTADMIKERCQIKSGSFARELPKLIKLGLVYQKNGTVQEEMKVGSGSKKYIKIKTKKARLYYINQEFKLLNELRELIMRATSMSHKRLLSQIKRLGRIKMVVVSGIFINNDTTRTDLFIVGDDIKERALARFLQQIESELGKTIQYTIMDTEEFKYRMNMYDRFLKDIMERPHEKLMNKLHA